jgi:predicted AlkP superfamily pyrophosphatase or phosphodiesterase
MARDLGGDVLLRLVRGYVPGRSGEIVLVPKPWNVVAQWPGGLRGAADPRTTHASPWAYLERVPIILYGPGVIRSGLRSDRQVDLADLAPTFADILGFDFPAPDGDVLREAMLRERGGGPPRVVVLVAYDGGGWNLLERWPGAWPNGRRLAEEGAVYTNATVGSAPPVTAPVHATMGTGAYPRVHLLAENTARLPNGEVGETFFHQADPRLLRATTLADAWDAANGNRPWVGMIGFHSWHLGMMGKGARSRDGDRDVAVLWDREQERFGTNEEFYSLPSYLPGETDLERRVRELDGLDGSLDGRWRGSDLADPFLLPGTPAFVDFVGDALFRMLRREPIGADALTDMLLVELQASDYAGHVWNMESEETRDVLLAQDRLLGRLVSFLDREIGPGGYVLALTADHGQAPLPEVTGGLRIDRFRLVEDLNELVGAGVVEAVHPDDIYLDMEAVAAAGLTVEQIARLIAGYRYRDGLPEGAELSPAEEERLDDRVFAAVIPGAFLMDLADEEARAFGPGRYAQGDLTTPPRVRSL